MNQKKRRILLTGGTCALALVCFAATGLVSLVGWLVYRRMSRRV